jgi:hypothetical protein
MTGYVPKHYSQGCKLNAKQLLFIHQMEANPHLNLSYMSWEDLREGLLGEDDDEDFTARLSKKYGLLLGGPDVAQDLR